ncbi:hypothetical protein NQ318_000973 [Aromia moschata]|uniref:Reverse transcriptase domain-containing protein n=1 Tax=Aromia moschata TaxID=1265417 RepID=A0AAV8ZE49_9CUCU|nr:hypothetical protein NQ318_000973 [Aromia moschata]
MNPLKRPRIPKLMNVNKARDIISSANSILQQYLDGTNDLQKAHLGVYCASALILELNGQQVYTPNPNRKNKDSDTPMWKKRLEKNIDEYRADADVLSEFLAGNNSRRVMAKTQAIARKAQIDLNNADHRKQLLNLKDLLRQKAKAKGARLRRYNKLTKRKQQNAAFENNQKQFLRSLEKQGEEQPAEIGPLLTLPVWFCLALNPLSTLLNKTTAGYRINMINHGTLADLPYMDDLKLFSGSKAKLQVLSEITETFSDDIRMSFGLDKCATLRVDYMHPDLKYNYNAKASYDFSSNDPFPYPRYTDDWFNR